MRSRSVLVLLVIFALSMVACSGQPAAPGGELTPVNIYLSYIPNVQFSPYYVGIEKGFFADNGLDVTIDHKPESESIKLAATDEETVTVAVVSGEQVLLAREQEIPVVYVFEWYERFPVAVASKAELGITDVAGLAGHSVGTPMQEGASYIGLEALLFSAGLTDADIDLQVTGYTQVETLVTDRVESVVVYIANEPIQLEAQGMDVNLLYVSDYADLVSNGFVVNESLIDEQPELVRQIAKAFSGALDYTINHPDEAFEVAQGYVEGLDDPAVAETQREVLARSISLWEADRLGETNLSSWESMQDVLLDMGLLSGELDLGAAFTNEFLP
jgi:NitT/TauT family transport system substrate-binding protein